MLELLRKAQSGDGEAFRLLYAQLRPFLEREVTRLAGPVACANSFHDILQDTLLRAYERLGSFRGGPTEEDTQRLLQAWLARIARSVYLNRRRAQRARRRLPDGRLVPLGRGDSSTGTPDVAGKDPSPSHGANLEEQRQRVQRAVAGLAPEVAEIVRRHFFENQSYREIARQRGCTEWHVRDTIHTVLKNFKSLLGGLE